MSLSIDDDWLKPQGDGGTSSSGTGGIADLHLPPDLQLPDLGRWWVDLEFLDLASGPPAHYSSASQERNKNRNPTLGYNFPDIFFDTTSSTSLFDDNHRYDRFVGESLKDHGIDFEKGILADLFPSSSVSQPTEKLLDDLDLVPPSQSNSGDVSQRDGSNSVQSNVGQVDSGKQDMKYDDEDMYAMPPDVLQSISKNFSDLQQEFDKVDPSKIETFKIGEDVSSGGKSLKQFLELSDARSAKSFCKDADEEIYSVPPEVLDSISKNFSDLQHQFEKVASTVVGETDKIQATEPREPRLKRYLRIKSVRAFVGMKDIPPEGTVARISIQTDKQKNATIFTILPNDSNTPEQCFSVNTSDLSQAKSMVKPLHLEQLPIFKRILSNLIPGGKLKQDSHDQAKSMEADEKLLMNQLADHGIHLPKLSRTTVADVNPSTLWLCPDCNLGVQDLNVLKTHLLEHRNPQPFHCGDDVIFTDHHSILDQVSLGVHDRFEHVKKDILDQLAKTGIHLDKLNYVLLPDNDTTPLWICPECQTCFPEVESFKDHILGHHRESNLLENSGISAGHQDMQLNECQPQPHRISPRTAGLEEKTKDFVAEMSNYGIHLATVECELSSSDKSKKSWLCPDCRKGFPKLSLVKDHLFHHRQIKPFRCDEEGCNWAFYTPFKLKRHQQAVHQGTSNFTCNMPNCKSKTFSTIYNLNSHLKKHDRPLEFDCKLCPQKFDNRKALDTHVRSHHEYLGDFQCTSCPMKFLSADDLDKHSSFHSKTNSKVVCHETGCGKSFKKLSQLKIHQYQHTGDKPHRCQFVGCHWAFRTISKLRRHERSHKNERKHVCKICSKSYLRSEHLRGHLLSTHNQMRFACAIESCDKRFSAQSTLYSHMKKHKEGRNISKNFYRCVIETCGQRFQNRKLLSQHVSESHETEFAPKHLLAAVEQQSLEIPDDHELDFIALLSSVGDEISVDTNEMETSSLQNEPVATIVVTPREHELDAMLVHQGMLSNVPSISPRPKDLITVDTSAITPIKNNPDMIDHLIEMQDSGTKEIIFKSPKRKRPRNKSCPNQSRVSLLKSNAGLTRHKNEQSGTIVQNNLIDVVIIPEGFVGDFVHDDL